MRAVDVDTHQRLPWTPRAQSPRILAFSQGADPALIPADNRVLGTRGHRRAYF